MKKDVILTEHAMLRYFERAYGIDLDNMKDTILTEKDIEAIKFVKSGKVPLDCGLIAVVKDLSIVSIVGKE